MMNFKTFMSNAAAWLNGSNDMDPSWQPNLPLNTVEIPTQWTKEPVRIFRVLKRGKAYEVFAENNVSWFVPSQHYIHLLHIGKAPQIGDKVMLEFYRDGSVKSFKLIKRREPGLAG